ncbi:chemotaxis protein CheW, partial [Candidatus Magnetomorum sp. HK-1]
TTVQEQILQLVAFNLKNEIYAIDINNVQEIIRYQEITEIPLTEENLLGVINLRGKIVPVIDLKIKFGFSHTELTELSRIVVVSSEDIVVGMLVDSVSEVLRIESSKIEIASPVLANESSEKTIKGIAKVNDKVITILNLDKSLYREKMNQK